MFSYYGSKSKIVQYYPRPTTLKIREPFVGSARYSILYWEIPDIVIVDKYKIVVDIWRYLQRATIKDIESLPKLKEGDTLNNYNLSYEEKILLGMLIAQASTQPRNKVSPFKPYVASINP